MDSRDTDNARVILPSEALNRDFGDAASLLTGLAAADEENRGATSHAVVIGNIGLLLPGDQISELVEGQAVCRLPNTAAWFSGVTSVRGDMVPVFDIHALLGIGHAGITRRMIVVSEHDKAVAFWVDGYPRLVSLGDEDTMTSTPPVPAMIRDHARRYFLKDGEIWIEWNIEAFFINLGNLL